MSVHTQKKATSLQHLWTWILWCFVDVFVRPGRGQNNFSWLLSTQKAGTAWATSVLQVWDKQPESNTSLIYKLLFLKPVAWQDNCAFFKVQNAGFYKEKQSFCCRHNLKSTKNFMKCIYDSTVLCSERQNVTYAYMSPEKTSFLPTVAVQIKGVCSFI